MAFKIQNTTVIGDTRELLNINEATFTGNTHIKLPAGTTAERPANVVDGSFRYNTDNDSLEGYANGVWVSLGGGATIIETPVNLSPADQEANVIAQFPNLTLEASPYKHLYDIPKANGIWQVSVFSNFSNTVVDATVSGTGNTYTLDTVLDTNVTYYWRVKYEDTEGTQSAFSSPTEFTTAASFGPTVIGESFAGGYYTGTIDIGGGVCYYLIVAPNATGCAQCIWKTTNTCTGSSGSGVNGYLNTYGALNNSNHPAGNWTATRTIDGFSDWYLPGITELGCMRTYRNNMPVGERYSDCTYWSSTETNAPGALCQNFQSGSVNYNLKDGNFRVRAIRREPV